MLQFPGIQRSRHKRGIFVASSVLLLLSTSGLAQSGRKTAKPSPSPANIPATNDEKSAPKADARDLTHKVRLLVGRQPTSKHLISEDAIFSNFLNRLQEITNVSATSIGDLKRDDNSSVIELAPSDFTLEVRRQDPEYLPIDVIDRRAKEQQRTNHPAHVSHARCRPGSRIPDNGSRHRSHIVGFLR